MLNEYDSEAEEPVETPARKASPADKLAKLLQSPNIAADLENEPEKLAEISAKVIQGYDIDDASRAEWKEKNKEGLKLASLFVDGPKDSPFPGASNVKAPLITVAALQFNARAYPALIQGDRVVKCKVNGHDEDGTKAKRAERVSEHASWQLTTEMPEWEEDTDRLTLIVAITGSIFRKHYWDPTLGRQCSRLILADKFVYNYRARSIEDCPRITEELHLYPYEIEERIRDGRFVEFEYGQGEDTQDDQSPHLFLEQHRLWDLDGDGYAEPYIITVHKETAKVCRIVANYSADSVRVTEKGKVAAIRKRDYYTKYVFFQSPDGGSYGMGLGSLMGSTTETVNTIINEMIDAGHLANTQGGFISGLAGIKSKQLYFTRGEFKVLQTSMPLRDAVMPMKFDGPPETLFKLLGLMMEFAQDISSTKDVMTGDTGGKVMAPTTTLALIEQGLKVYSAIFKRLHRAIKRELEMHARLNHENLSPEAYNAFFDDEEQFDPQQDYDLNSMDISPISDPSVSTEMQKLAKSQVVGEITAGAPFIDQQEVVRRRLEAAGIEDIDKLFVPPTPPDPLMELLGKLEAQDRMAGITQKLTAAIKNIADAEAAEEGTQIAHMQQLLDAISMELGANAQVQGGPGGVPGVEGQPSDPMGAGAGPDAGGGLDAGVAGGPGQQPDPAALGAGPVPPPASAPQGAM